MTYKNANTIFPEQLLIEIQKYIRVNTAERVMR
jgi:hypothetical protein